MQVWLTECLFSIDLLFELAVITAQCLLRNFVEYSINYFVFNNLMIYLSM